MAEAVGYQVRDGVALITLQAPAVNALGAVVRAGLQVALQHAAADPAVTGVVLTAAGRVFSAGADIREFGAAPVAPSLRDLCARIEASPVPVVAAMQGAALGGGLELALAAHGRVASAAASLGLPEVNLGLVPGAGGTQRLPRLVGAEAALRLMLSGTAVSGTEALGLGLVDQVTDGDPVPAAMALVQTAGIRRPTLERGAAVADPVAYQQAVRAARAAHPVGAVLAVRRIIDCVEAAQVLPPEAGLIFEAVAFADCLASDASAGLRHLFLAERRAARAQPVAASLESVGLVGAGEQVAGLMVALLCAGLRAVVVAPDRAALIATLEQIATLQEAQVASGALTEAARDAGWARLGGSTDLAAVVGADLVLDAGEDAGRLDRMQGLGAMLGAETGAALGSGTVLATVAGGNLAALAAATGRADGVIGLQFGASLATARGVEIGVSTGCRPAAVAVAVGLARRLGKLALLSTSDAGLIAPRLQGRLGQVADWLVATGTPVEAVEAGMRAAGMAWRPLPAGMAGADAALNRGGTKPDPERLAAAQAGHGGVPRRAGQDEIVRRVLSALANEGARLLDDGVARQARDVDLVSVLVLGLARWRGGVMQAADLHGLMAVKRELQGFAADDPTIWTPHPLFADLIKNGMKFSGLDDA